MAVAIVIMKNGKEYKIKHDYKLKEELIKTIFGEKTNILQGVSVPNISCFQTAENYGAGDSVVINSNEVSNLLI